MTLEELRGATRALLRKKGADARRPSPAAAAIVEGLRGSSALRGVSVHVSDGKVRFGPVPLAALAGFARVLGGVELPPIETKSGKKKATRAS